MHQLLRIQLMEAKLFKGRDNAVRNAVVSDVPVSEKKKRQYQRNGFSFYPQSFFRDFENRMDCIGTGEEANYVPSDKQLINDLAFINSKIKPSHLCFWTSCLGKTVFIDDKGDISSCPFSSKAVKANDLSSCHSFPDLFDNQQFRQLLAEQVSYRKGCISDCGYYPFCRGGCALREKEGCAENCRIRKAVDSIPDFVSSRKTDTWAIIKTIEKWRQA